MMWQLWQMLIVMTICGCVAVALAAVSLHTLEHAERVVIIICLTITLILVMYWLIAEVF